MNEMQCLMQMAEVKAVETKPVAREGKPDGKQYSAFRKLMQSREQSTETPEQSGQTPKLSREANLVQLQQLAAMQMLSFQPVQVNLQTAEPGTVTETTAAVTAEIMVDGQINVMQNSQSLPTPDLQTTANAEILQQPESLSTAEKQPAVQQQTVFANQQIVQPADAKPVPTEQQMPMKAAEEVEQNADLIQHPEEKQKSVYHAPERKDRKLETQETETEPQPLFSQTDPAPVKVSETARPQETPEFPKPEKQVMEKLETMLKSGDRKLELQLQPHNLGKIRIELLQKEDGSLHIALHVEHSQVRELLERSLSEMQQLIRRNTQQNILVQVSKPQEQEQKQFYNQQHRQQGYQQQEQRREPKHQEDFLNQLRLGLVSDGQRL